MQTIVWTDVNTHFTGSTGFPDDTNSSIVVPRDEEPRLHIFESLVWVLDRLRLP